LILWPSSAFAATAIDIPVFGSFVAGTTPDALMIAGRNERAVSDHSPPFSAQAGESGSTPSDDGSGCPTPHDDLDSASSTQSSLSRFFPANDNANAAGFLPLGIEETTCFEDTLFAISDDESGSIGWESGLYQSYLTGEKWNGIEVTRISVDQFDTVRAASAIMDRFARDDRIIRQSIQVSTSTHTDQFVAFTNDDPEDGTSVTFILARFNDVILVVATGARHYRPTEGAAIALWDVVDEANR
jgi:hypothetical protein